MQQITAMGGGGFLVEDTPLLDDCILSRARGSASRVGFVATASGDRDRMLVNFYTALGPRCRATHLPLFRRQHADVVAHLLAQDVIDVGGGTPPNMLAVGRVHGVDLALRRAYGAGILLCGVSAGALCWFDSGVTDAFGGPLRRLDDALGLRPGSVCPHDDGDPRRRPTDQQLVAEGLPPGFAADVGGALHCIDGALAEIVTSRPHVRAYRVERRRSGDVHEEPLPVHHLGAPQT
jgi:dipeptidase E